MAQASIMSAWTGLESLRLALRTSGLEPAPRPGFRAKLWFFIMVSRPAMPGRMLLRPPPKPAMKWYTTPPVRMILSQAMARLSSHTGVPREVVPT